MAQPEIEDDTASGIDPMKNWKDEEVDSSLVQEQQDIQFTRNKRRQIVSGLMANGVPQDTELLKLTLTALNDMDRTSIARARIKADEKTTGITAAATEMISRALLQVSGNTGKREGDNKIVPPKLPDDTDLSDVPDTVLRTGVSTANYETFQAAEAKR